MFSPSGFGYQRIRTWRAVTVPVRMVTTGSTLEKRGIADAGMSIVYRVQDVGSSMQSSSIVGGPGGAGSGGQSGSTRSETSEGVYVETDWFAVPAHEAFGYDPSKYGVATPPTSNWKASTSTVSPAPKFTFWMTLTP